MKGYIGALVGMAGYLILVGMAGTIDAADEFFLFSFPSSAGSEAPSYVISMWEIGFILLAFCVLFWGVSRLWTE